MLRLDEYKVERKNRLLKRKLTEILEIFDSIEPLLTPYKHYVPAQSVITSISENRTFARLALKKLKDSDDPT